MSEDRDRMWESDDESTETEDVEAHQLSGGPGQLSGFGANDEGDDVEAHQLSGGPGQLDGFGQLSGGPGQLSGFGANDDDGDDVEAHKLY